MEINNFNSFAKGKIEKCNGDSHENCFIYTRVSTKDQFENNLSIETQEEACKNYADRKRYNIAGNFGGTYESAKTDDRKEFRLMLDALQTSKLKITRIIVYSYDRFSRSGSNAIDGLKNLQKNKIALESVTQPVDDPFSAVGQLQQGIGMIFSKYDNDQRKEKCVAGMLRKLRLGYRVTRPPTGYKAIGEGNSIPDNNAKYIVQTFTLKAEGIANVEIQSRLKAMGFEVSVQLLEKIIKNPFYCGMITHGLLEGEVVKGAHKPIISQALFFKANGIAANFKKGEHNAFNNESFPLKKIVVCKKCGKPLTGYFAKKKYPYYKCNGKGCKTDINAAILHGLFLDLLQQYTLEQRLIEPFKQILKETFNRLNIANIETRKQINDRIQDLKSKIDKIRERHVIGEISKEDRNEYSGRYLSEVEQGEQELAKIDMKLSNLDDYIDYAIKMCSNLRELWQNGEYDTKVTVQQCAFPEGISFEKSSQNYRTLKVSSFFEVIGEINKITAGDGTKKGDSPDLVSEKSPLVALWGIEPQFDG